MSSGSNKSKTHKKYRSLLKNIKKQTSEKATHIRKVMPFTAKSRKLKEELALLTSYCSDTVYRLRYDKMTYDYISPAVIKLLGFTPEEMKKINFRSLILETKIISNGIKSISSYNDLEDSRKNGDVNKWQADYLVRTKDGRKVWITDISYPWFNEKGNIIGSIGSLRDINDRIQAEAKSREELLRMAHTDALTGLANRGTFFRTLDSELKRVKRSGSAFSILLVDIDYFKRINDTHGHAGGDQVLIEVTKIMKECVRETDMVARVGGEEFAIFLPDTPEDGAFWVADRICNTIAKHNFFLKESIMPIPCTVSIGIASTENHPEEATPTDIYKQADTRLYIAKNTGRNQVSRDEILQVH